MKNISNDVQNSDKRLMLLSAPYGGSNANGFSIVAENFESAMTVYGVRKSVKQNWLNDKDEFFIEDGKLKSSDFKQLSRLAILWSILDGGYTSSLRNIQWKKKKYKISNGFFALTIKDLGKIRGVDLNTMPDNDTIAAKWIERKMNEFSLLEKEAIKSYRILIAETFLSGNRNNADPKSQCYNPDASPRQLINGLFRDAGVLSLLKYSDTQFNLSGI